MAPSQKKNVPIQVAKENAPIHVSKENHLHLADPAVETLTPEELFVKELQYIRNLSYYHGLRPRAEVEKELQCPGDYLVRILKPKSREVILSVCVVSAKEANRLIHLPITWNAASECWELSLLHQKKGLKKKSNRTSTVETKEDTKEIPVNNKSEKFEKNKSENKPRSKKTSENTFETLLRTFKSYNPRAPGVFLRKKKIRPSWYIDAAGIKYDASKDFLGEGNFCRVVKGMAYKVERDKKCNVTLYDPLEVAIKMSLDEVDSTRKGNDGRESCISAMFHEAMVMGRVSHHNVVKLIGITFDVPPFLIVMECCPGGSLELHLQREKEDISDAERILYCFEIARGMRSIHEHKFIHRDLATRNCLIAADGKIKISDFGLSRAIIDVGTSPLDSKKETAMNIPLRWMAPEAISRHPVFSTKSDIWAFGVVLYEIFNLGIKPWPEEEDNKKILACIKRNLMPEIPERTPSVIKDLLRRCWSDKPAERPEFRLILAMIVNLQKSSPKYALPKTTECSTNRIPGVLRGEIKANEGDEALAGKSMMCSLEHMPTSKGGNTSEDTTCSKEISKESRKSRESRESVEEDGLREVSKQLPAKK